MKERGVVLSGNAIAVYRATPVVICSPEVAVCPVFSPYAATNTTTTTKTTIFFLRVSDCMFSTTTTTANNALLLTQLPRQPSQNRNHFCTVPPPPPPTPPTPRSACASQIKEEDGDVAGAAEVLQEVHVETYGALTKKEKADFILEQVGLRVPTTRSRCCRRVSFKMWR